MISLSEYRQRWEEFEIGGEKPRVCAVTLDREMARRIQEIPMGIPVLFWLPPGAKSAGSGIDSFREDNSCLVFLMEKYDPQRETTLQVLERTQPGVEALKTFITGSLLPGCSGAEIDPGSLDTMPETKFYGNFAGWSVAFRIKTDDLPWMIR